MPQIFCQKCGTQNETTSTFCYRCGAQLNDGNFSVPNQSAPISPTAVKRVKNPFTKWIFIVIAIQIVLLLVSTQPGTIGGVAFFAAMFLSVAVFFFSILTSIKAKKYANKGLVVGVVFSVLTIVLISIVVISLIFTSFGGSSEQSEEKYFEQSINTVATASIGSIKSSLKDPSSLKINRIYAQIYDTRISVQYSDGTYSDGGEFTGYFKIYVDLTATNGFGGVSREYYYFQYNQDLECIGVYEIDSMPTVDEGIWVLDTEEYNAISQDMAVY